MILYMDEKLKCIPCNKYYKSPSSLCNHKKKFHSSKITQDNHRDNQNITVYDDVYNPNIINKDYAETANKYKCKYCEKGFKYNQNKWRHEKRCNNTYKKNMDDLKEENKMLKQDMDEIKKIVNDLLNKNCKMHYKTLNKINNSAGRDLNNGVINNTINIMALGRENIDDVLTKTDKLTILNKKENALPYMIELVHFNDKFPQFKNIAITNNRNIYAHVYDTESKIFKLVDKNALIEELIDYRVCDIEDYYMQYKKELDAPVREKIEELIENRGDNDNTKDRIKLLLFNNRHKIDI